MHMLTKPQAFYDESHKTTLGYQNPFYLSHARRKLPALYDGHTIVKTHVALSVTDTKETLKLAKESRLKMLAKQNDPSLKEKNVNITLVDYVALNKLSEHFVPQKQLSAEQTFRLPISKPIVVKPPVLSELVLKKEIPRELPPINLVHTAVNSLAAIHDYKSMQWSFIDEYNETLVLKAKLAKKHDMIEKVVYNELSKRCSRLENRVQNVHNSNVVTLKVYKLDLPPLSPSIKNNMAAHVDYLKHTQENANILREIVEHARDLRPLDSDLASDFAVTPMNRTRKVRFEESNDTSKDKTQKQVQPQEKQTTNNSMSPSTGVSSST
ncbi:hypothetical protein Tco_1478021 [Tanacetum coccineum]